MQPPDAADFVAYSKMEPAELGYPDEADLEPVMVTADAYIIAVTGRNWEGMPPYLEAIANQAAVIRAEQNMYHAQPDYSETAADDVVGSFSAGSYSETRHDPNRRGEARPLSTETQLNELLWLLLCTTPAYPDPNVDAMYDYWRSLLGGTNAPSFEISEVDWAGTGTSPDWYSQWQKAI